MTIQFVACCCYLEEEGKKIEGVMESKNDGEKMVEDVNGKKTKRKIEGEPFRKRAVERAFG